MEKYRIETALDKAVSEFLALNEEEQTPINVRLLARKYSPVTMKQCLDVLNENIWIFVLDSRQGNTLLDVVIAVIETYLGASIEYKVGLQRQNTAMEEARRAALADNLRIKRL